MLLVLMRDGLSVQSLITSERGKNEPLFTMTVHHCDHVSKDRFQQVVERTMLAIRHCRHNSSVQHDCISSSSKHAREACALI